MLQLPLLALWLAVATGQVAPADPVPAPEPVEPPAQQPERPALRTQPPGAPDVPPPPADPRQPPDRPQPPDNPTPPGPPSSQPVDDAAQTDRPTLDPATAAWLDRIEARADELQTLLAKVRYDRREGLLGAEQRRFGTLVYHAGPPARFDVVFDRAIIDGTPRREEQRWTFDGRWLAERRPEDRVFIRRELAPKGQTRDLLRMGEGPFALPLDLDRKRTLERFDVALIPAAEGDPADSIHLRLTPLESTKEEAGVERVDLWYDRQTLLPRRAATLQDAEGGIETIVDLLEASPKAEVDDTRFDTMPPETGWEVQVVPLAE